MVLFFFLIIFCIFSFIAGWTSFGFILLFITVIVGIYGFFFISTIDEKQKEKDKKRKIMAAKRNAENESKALIYKNELNELITKYGEPDKTIILENFNLSKEIIVFGKTNRIWILGRDLSMNDILHCSLSDNSKVIEGKINYETNTDGGNMIKRAVIGNIILGGTGAIIGGNTAKKTTIATQEKNKIYHNYTAIININSLSDPILKINIKDDDEKATEIIGLINVIISRNKG